MFTNCHLHDMCNIEHQNTILLSIILPVYNVAQYIPRLMNSLLDLRLPHDKMEIIFVDDCSPDNSADIIEKYIINKYVMRLIKHKRNKRAGGGRNTGLLAAKGEYVFFVDPDDEIIPEGVISAMEHLENSHDKLDVAMFDILSSSKNTLSYSSNCTDVMNGADYFLRNSVAWGPWTSMYRRQYLLEKNLFFMEDVMFEDVEWVLRAQALAATIQYQPIAIYYYHHNQGSQCYSAPIPKGSEDRIRCSIKIAEIANIVFSEKVQVILRAHSRLAFREAIKSLIHHSFFERAAILKKINNQEVVSVANNVGGLMKTVFNHPVICNIFMEFIHILLPLYKSIK